MEKCPVTKSRILKVLGVLLVVVAIGAVVGMILRPDVIVRVEASTIETKVAAKLPLSGSKLGVDWQLLDLDLSLLDDGRVRVTPKVHLDIGRFDVDAIPTAVGRIVYDEGSVHVSDLVIEELNPTSDESGTRSRAAEILRGIMPDSWEERGKEVVGDAIQRVLDVQPVYVLPNTGASWWAKQAISRVDVVADAVVVHVDPFGLLLRALIWAGIALLVVIGSIAFVIGMLSSTAGAAAGIAFISLS